MPPEQPVLALTLKRQGSDRLAGFPAFQVGRLSTRHTDQSLDMLVNGQIRDSQTTHSIRHEISETTGKQQQSCTLCDWGWGGGGGGGWGRGWGGGGGFARLQKHCTCSYNDSMAESAVHTPYLTQFPQDQPDISGDAVTYQGCNRIPLPSALSSTKTECDYLYGWFIKTVTYTDISPQMAGSQKKEIHATDSKLNWYPCGFPGTCLGLQGQS